MKQFGRVISAGFLGVCLLLSLSGVALSAEGHVFKFASLYPLSGPAAGWGIPANRALKYVVEDYNKNGGLLVNGQRYKIELIEYDTKYQTSEGVTLLNKAIFGDKVKYITVMGQHICVIAAPICEANGVLHLASASGGAELTNAKFTKTFRMMNPNSLGSLLYYPEVMKEFGVKTIALVNPDDDGGYTTSKAIGRVVEGLSPAPKIVADEYYVRGTSDFTPVILRVLAKKPDLIDLGISSPGDTGLFLKQMGEAGYKGLHMNSASVVSTDVLWQLAGDYARGHFVIWAFGEPPTPLYKMLTERYMKDYSGTTVVPVIFYFSYNSLDALFQAIEKANTFDTTKVADTLGNMKWKSLYGPARWMGKEKALGFGINRSLSTVFPMSRISKGGTIEKWGLKSLPLE